MFLHMITIFTYRIHRYTRSSRPTSPSCLKHASRRGELVKLSYKKKQEKINVPFFTRGRFKVIHALIYNNKLKKMFKIINYVKDVK